MAGRSILTIAPTKEIEAKVYQSLHAIDDNSSTAAIEDNTETLDN